MPAPVLIFAIVLAGHVIPGDSGGRDSARTAAALRPRVVRAVRLTGPPPTIDGRLDEPVWQSAPAAVDFVQSTPTPGALARFSSEARILYDRDALYVGIRLYDPHPDSIVAPYPRRDDETTSDWVFVEIDSRHDHRSGFSFGVNPRGVEVDGTWADDIVYDASWDAVWQAAAHVDSLGWTAEYRIPLSQLAYTGAPDWGLNIYRHVARTGESSDWSPRLPTIAGVVSKFNTLSGLDQLPAARTIEVTPYVALAEERAPSTTGNPFANADATKPSVGADIRVGLGSGFNATATLHPDFGQVEADPSEINLTTFETFFTERRPFFVQQANLFRYSAGLTFHTRGDAFDSDQPFYSRRIGGPPHGILPVSALFSDTPQQTPILGAAKIAGYTTGGWSIGVLDAVTDADDARYIDTIDGPHRALRLEPRANYGVVRLSRSFDNGDDAIGAVATSVTRFGSGPAFDNEIAHNAYTAGVDGRYRFGHDAFEVTGFAIGSRIAGTPQAIAGILDGPGHYLHVDTAQTVADGGAAQLRVARISGEHWRWSLIAHMVSPQFDVNDLGFQRNADWLLAVASLTYSEFQPHGLFNSWTLGTNQIGEGWSFHGLHRANVLNLAASGTFRNYWQFALSEDHELPALSTDALRGGPALLMPWRDNLIATLTSDYRRTTQLTVTDTTVIEPETHSLTESIAPAVDFRASDRARLAVGPEYAHVINGWQFVPTHDGTYVLGRLRQQTWSLTAHATYAFSRMVTLEAYANPFVSTNRYDQFKAVVAPRANRVEDRTALLAPGEIHFPNPSFTERDLNLNAVMRWEFRPGSTLFVVWTQERQRSPDLDTRGAINTLLVKLSYWLGR